MYILNLCRNLYEFVGVAQFYICPPTGPQRIKVIIVWTQMACMDGQLTHHQHWKKALRKMGGSIKTPTKQMHFHDQKCSRANM